MESFPQPLVLLGIEAGQQQHVIAVEARGDGDAGELLPELVQDVKAAQVGHLGRVERALRDVKLRVILLDPGLTLMEQETSPNVIQDFLRLLINVNNRCRPGNSFIQKFFAN